MFNKKYSGKKKREIVFVIPQFPHVSETFLVAQILTAINLGYDIKIITRKFINHNVDLIEKYNWRDKIIIQDYKIPSNKLNRGLKWLCLLLKNLNDIGYIVMFYKEQKTFSLTWLYQLVFYKQFNNASIFHIQYGTNSNPLSTLKKIDFLKPSMIVTFHGHDAFFPLYGYIENNGYYNNLFSCNAIITANTPYLSKKIESLGCSKNKLKTIPVGVNTSYFYPKREGSSNDVIKLITVGRLDNIKGHQYCIEVIYSLLKQGVKAKLTIIGEGEERARLETIINKYKLNKSINLLGSKNSGEVREALWKHDVYLLLAAPVENDRRETQGLATLEAQACGLPAIVFDSGGVKYTVKDKVSGFVYEEYDVEAVAEKVKYLSKNRENLNSMGENAVKFVNDKYSQKTINEKWKHLYNDILKHEG